MGEIYIRVHYKVGELQHYESITGKYGRPSRDDRQESKKWQMKTGQVRVGLATVRVLCK